MALKASSESPVYVAAMHAIGRTRNAWCKYSDLIVRFKAMRVSSQQVWPAVRVHFTRAQDFHAIRDLAL